MEKKNTLHFCLVVSDPQNLHRCGFNPIWKNSSEVIFAWVVSVSQGVKKSLKLKSPPSCVEAPLQSLGPLLHPLASMVSCILLPRFFATKNPQPAKNRVALSDRRGNTKQTWRSDSRNDKCGYLQINPTCLSSYSMSKRFFSNELSSM